jgi:hypothetical protein
VLDLVEAHSNKRVREMLEGSGLFEQQGYGKGGRPLSSADIRLIGQEMNKTVASYYDKWVAGYQGPKLLKDLISGEQQKYPADRRVTDGKVLVDSILFPIREILGPAVADRIRAGCAKFYDLKSFTNQSTEAFREVKSIVDRELTANREFVKRAIEDAKLDA